ncbi:MAG TPA: SAM-dependent methyltransferase [Solirubrobacteraceae bacterium]|jgi:hypothetical protein
MPGTVDVDAPLTKAPALTPLPLPPRSLPERRFERVLQVGCVGGALTEQLASHCERLVVLDDFPHQTPVGVWDLVVCADVLRNLDVETLLRTTHWLSRQLTAGATVLIASRAADAHHLLIHRLACWHAYGELRDGIRIDRFDGDGIHIDRFDGDGSGT